MSMNTLANFFYEQCAGTTTGHMANIPNNTVLFSLMRAYSKSQDQQYALTKVEFANLLRDIATELNPAG